MGGTIFGSPGPCQHVVHSSSRQVEDKVRNLNTSNPSSDEAIRFYKNFFEDKTGSKVEVQTKKDKFKVVLNFNSSEALRAFVEKVN